MKLLQNRISESRITLPVAAIYCTLVWFAAGLVAKSLWLPFLLMAVSAYIMVETNNHNALLRIRSRMVSSTFVVLSAMLITSGVSWQSGCIQAITAAIAWLLCSVYQDKTALARIFYVFLLTGVLSLIEPQLILLTPLIIILLIRPLNAFSGHALSAAIAGLLVPYWVLVPYLVLKGDFELLMHAQGLWQRFIPEILNYSSVSVQSIIIYSILLFLFILSWGNFIRVSYKDKVRTRALFNMFIAASAVFFLLAAIIPTHAGVLLPILTVTVSPIIAHFFTFTSSKVTNVIFIISVAAIFFATIAFTVI